MIGKRLEIHRRGRDGQPADAILRPETTASVIEIRVIDVLSGITAREKSRSFSVTNDDAPDSLRVLSARVGDGRRSIERERWKIRRFPPGRRSGSVTP